jgi:hypothetical protein
MTFVSTKPAALSAVVVEVLAVVPGVALPDVPIGAGSPFCTHPITVTELSRGWADCVLVDVCCAANPTVIPRTSAAEVPAQMFDLMYSLLTAVAVLAVGARTATRGPHLDASI